VKLHELPGGLRAAAIPALAGDGAHLDADHAVRRPVDAHQFENLAQALH
jgi:hypothetical protein